jgi:transcriptional regulator with XRE-family HTH domain
MVPKSIPKRLGEKLKAIREHRGWTLDEMAAALGREGASRRARVYEWEAGVRQPDLPTLLAYARLAGVSTDVLIDDEQELTLERQ